jgi:SAM-dependent methyltransferase
MHPTAMSNGKLFFDAYVSRLGRVNLVEIGSQDFNGSLRSVCPDNVNYIGVDCEPGKGVDIVLKDPYSLPFPSCSVDIAVSSSSFEHSEMFWLVFNEVLRVLNPSGLFYLNAPSNGAYHRYPVDCWRFFPDWGKALVAWAKRSGMSPALLESYVSRQRDDIWSDFVAIFVKDEACAVEHPNRILSTFEDFENGYLLGKEEVINRIDTPEDIRRLERVTQQLHDAESQLAAITSFSRKCSSLNVP